MTYIALSVALIRPCNGLQIYICEQIWQRAHFVENAKIWQFSTTITWRHHSPFY